MPESTPVPDARTVLVEDRDELRRVTLQRAPTNALSGPEYVAVRAAFEVPGAARVCVLRGRGRFFCSGQDLDEAAAMTVDEMAMHLTSSGAAIAAAARSPIPLVTIVNGPAVGAGALLVALSDVVVMSDLAWLSFPEAHYGLPLGLSLLSRFVPERLARQLMATGSRISADRLASLGAVDHVVPVADLDEVAENVIADLIALPVKMSEWLHDTPERGRRANDYLDELSHTVAARDWRL